MSPHILAFRFDIDNSCFRRAKVILRLRDVWDNWLMVKDQFPDPADGLLAALIANEHLYVEGREQCRES